MSKPVVLILGATGPIGRATIKHLVALSGGSLDIRAGTRNLDKAPDELKSQDGVQIVKVAVGDDKKHLRAVFKDVERLFIIPPPIYTAADVVTQAAEVAKEVGIKHVLLLSDTSSVVPPDYKYQYLKGSTAIYEKKVRELFPHSTVVSLPFFMENNLALAASVKATGSFALPMRAQKKTYWVAVDDAGKVYAAILNDPEKHKGKYYTLTNDEASYSDLASYLTEVIGKQIQYQQISYDIFAQEMKKVGESDLHIEVMTNLFHLVDEDEDGLEKPGASQDFLSVMGERPLTLKQWCYLHAKEFQ